MLELDDGWPESVEEQGLLLLVWRHAHERVCAKEDQGTFTHRHFYPQKLLQTEAFTQTLAHTQTLSHTDAFTHRRLYTQTL